MTDAEVAELVRGQLPASGLELRTLTVAEDANGSRVLTIELVAESVEAANREILEFSPGGKLFGLVDKVNAEYGAQVAICRLDIVDAQGQPLVRYVRDVQLAQENWWQAPGMTKDWFPHPPEPTSSAQ